MSDLLSLDFMRQALIAAVLVGLAAPLVGAFLVQRRMSLIGDGIGHVALAGVTVGILTFTLHKKGQRRSVWHTIGLARAGWRACPSTRATGTG